MRLCDYAIIILCYYAITIPFTITITIIITVTITITILYYTRLCCTQNTHQAPHARCIRFEYD